MKSLLFCILNVARWLPNILMSLHSLLSPTLLNVHPSMLGSNQDITLMSVLLREISEGELWRVKRISKEFDLLAMASPSIFYISRITHKRKTRPLVQWASWPQAPISPTPSPKDEDENQCPGWATVVSDYINGL